MSNQLISSLFTLLTISVTLVSSRDLINFNVYQTGSRIHGHYKTINREKINFQIDQVNSSYFTFNLVSGKTNPLDINGDCKVVEHDNGAVQFKAQASSNSVLKKVTIDTNVTNQSNGHLIKTQIYFNINDIIVKYSLRADRLDLSSIDIYDNCPFSFSHNISTVPADLISFESSINGVCYADQSTTNNVTLDAKLGSTEWHQLNTTLIQVWNLNSTGGSEKMTFNNVNFGSMVLTNEWVNQPIPKTRKIANFTSNSSFLPSFLASYNVDDQSKTFIYSPY